jgi:gamma-glutamyltranspeptidase/glutathione hydrolase
LRTLPASAASVFGRTGVRATGEDRSQSRSMVIADTGVVASESVLASQVGARILEHGGNAVDAAVAANAMMGLVAPMNDGIGGDLFALVYEARSGRLHGLNASGWSPAALTADALLAQGVTEMPQRGILSVTVPGTVDGWDQLLRRFGTRSMAEVLAPTIVYAQRGFAVSEVVASYWRDSVPILEQDPATARLYLPGGRAPDTGELFTNPELASTLRQIAASGKDAFYKEAVAKQILATVALHGGTLDSADLGDYESEWVEPIATSYRGWDVYELPPNGQGIAALQMLNIMEQFPLSAMGHNSARALHTMIEAKKLAYADLLRYVADPRCARIPVAGLNSKQYAVAQAKRIDPARANCGVVPGTPPATDGGTTYIAVVDKVGNMVSLIQSNFASIGFGSGFAVAGAGFVLQNRGALFTLQQTHPNVLAGRKRPLHTIIPGFMSQGDKRLAFGIMGGWNQAQAHAQFVSNVVDFGMNIQAALDAARFSKDTFEGCDVNLEGRIAAATRAELAAMDHQVILRGDYSSALMGSGQAVGRDFGAGMNYGASDPRKDGAAVMEIAPIG